MKERAGKFILSLLAGIYFLGFIWRTVTLAYQRWDTVHGYFDTGDMVYQCLWEASTWPLSFGVYLIASFFK